MKSIAIIQHIGNDGPSFFATWLQQQGIAFKTFLMHEGVSLPTDISAHSGLCILGGPMSANDPLPYFPRLLEQVRQAVALDVPVIGHCLGGQIMSRALGGTVQASENTEIGWALLQATHPIAAEWFGSAETLPLFQWHGESFSIPPGATQLLRGTHCANQAYLVGNKHLGMQFHCEVDEEKVRDWLVEGAEEMDRCESPGVQQAQDILKSLHQDLVQSQAIASHIYSRWAQGLRF
jgi:GMP synthase-like glutamine amidotransferase